MTSAQTPTPEAGLLWGGRFESGPDAALMRLSTSPLSYFRLAPQDLRGCRAHARELERAGLLDAGETVRMLAALDEIEADIAEAQSTFNAGGLRFKDYNTTLSALRAQEDAERAALADFQFVAEVSPDADLLEMWQDPDGDVDDKRDVLSFLIDRPLAEFQKVAVEDVLIRHLGTRFCSWDLAIRL